MLSHFTSTDPTSSLRSTKGHHWSFVNTLHNLIQNITHGGNHIKIPNCEDTAAQTDDEAGKRRSETFFSENNIFSIQLIFPIESMRRTEDINIITPSPADTVMRPSTGEIPTTTEIKEILHTLDKDD